MSTDAVLVKLDELQAMANTLMTKITTGAEQLEECRESKRVEQLKEAAKTVITTTVHIQNFRTVYEAATREVRLGVTSERIAELQHQLADKARESPTSIAWSRHPEYQAFTQSICEVNDLGESPSTEAALEDGDAADVVVEASKRSLKCPLTQTYFVEPVTNPSCGHTFSKEAILQLARSSTSVPCPIAGCSRAVQVARLRPEEGIARAISRMGRVRIFE